MHCRPFFQRLDVCTFLLFKQESIDWELATLIIIAEAVTSIRKTKNSAPGPDNHRLREVLASPIEQLTILFNSMRMYRPGGLPDGIFDSRIVFIKKTRTPSSPQDYRPIAIGNFIIRIFHRIEGSISNHPDQVSFKRVDWIGYNILKLHNIVNESWKKQRVSGPIYQPLHSDRIWHEVTFKAEFNRFEFRVFLLLD